MKIYVMKFSGVSVGEIMNSEEINNVDEGKIKVLLDRIGYMFDIIFG